MHLKLSTPQHYLLITMKKIFLYNFSIILLFFSLSGYSQIISPKQYFTIEISQEIAPTIDGFLEDNIWGKVKWGEDFVEVNPDENTPPTEQTKFKILYDQKYLYVAILALDSAPETITKRLSRRDGFEGEPIYIRLTTDATG